MAKAMLPNNVSYLVFGKKHGFQCFECAGFLNNKESGKARLEIEAFLQLDLLTTHVPEETGLWASYRFDWKGGHHFCFVLFFPARDAVARPGFYGAALVFRNGYLSNIQAMADFLQQLVKVAEAHVKNWSIPELRLPLMELFPYPQRLLDEWNNPVSLREKKLPVLLHPDPAVFKFIEATYRNFFIACSDKAFFVPNPASIDEFDVGFFSVLPYGRLFKKTEEELEKMIQSQLDLSANIESNNKKLEGELQKKHAELADLEKNALALQEKASSIGINISDNEQKLHKIKVEMVEHRKMESDIKKVIHTLQCTKSSWDKTIKETELKHEQLKQQQQHLDTEILRKKAEKKLLENELVKASQRRIKLSKEMGQEQVRLTQLKQETEQYEQKKIALLQEIEQRQKEQAALELSVKRLTARKDKLKESTKVKRRQVQDLNKSTATTGPTSVVSTDTIKDTNDKDRKGTALIVGNSESSN